MLREGRYKKMTDQPEELAVLPLPSENMTTADLLQMLGLKEAQRSRVVEINVALQQQLRNAQAELATLRAELAAGPGKKNAKEITEKAAKED